MTSPTTKTAADFIRETTLFREERYSWLKPLVSSTLENATDESDLDRLISGVNGDVNSGEKSSYENHSNLSVKQITAIEKIADAGLVRINGAIKLNSGLTVFYGLNGSGKSSLFAALCKTLGRDDATVIPNLFGGDDNGCESKVTCVLSNMAEQTLQWKQGEPVPAVDCMVFDSRVSQYLVSEALPNEFKLSHLGSERFALLQALYDKLSNKYNDEIKNTESRLTDLTAYLRSQAPSLFNVAPLPTIDDVRSAEFSLEQQQQLDRLERQLKDAKRADKEMLLTALKRAAEKFTEFVEQISDSSGQFAVDLSSVGMASINHTVLLYHEQKAIADQNQRARSMVPQGWAISASWENFIRAAVNFVKTLDAEKQNELANTCPYCCQPLENELARNLVEAYREMFTATDGALEKAAQHIFGIAQNLDALAAALKICPQLQACVNQDASELGTEPQDILCAPVVVETLECAARNLRSLKSIDGLPAIEATISSVVSTVGHIHELYNQRIASLSDTDNREAQELHKAEGELGALKRKHDMAQHKDKFLDLVEFKRRLAELQAFSTDLTSARQITSSAESKFTNESGLLNFEQELRKEYSRLGYDPPEIWKVKASTLGGVSKRVYNLADRKLAEILSEGERKLHALAEFFAQMKTSGYDGLVVFDDPVNSLDEEYMDRVAYRIKDCIAAGQQVIVFTHNIVFLNMLLEVDREKIVRLFRYGKNVQIEPGIILDKPEASLKSRLKDISKKVGTLESAREAGAEPPEIDIRQIYDHISGALEDYAAHLFNKVIGRYRPNLRMHNLDSLPQNLNQKCSEILPLYNRASRFGVRHSQPPGVAAPTLDQLIADLASLQNICVIA